MNRLLPLLSIAVAAILAVMLLMAKREIANLTATSPTKAEDTAVAAGTPAVAAPHSEGVSAEPVAEPAPGSADAAEQEIDAEMVQKTLKNHQRVMTSIARMRENPTMNKMIEAGQRGTIGALYTDFIEYLGLDADETKYFMDLLMSRQMENVDFGMKLMGGQLSEEEKQAMAEHLKEVGDAMESQMETFLNSEKDFEEFKFYEKTIGERMALSQMDQKLAEAGQPLSDSEYRNLLDMMYREREGFDWSTNLHNQESTDIGPDRFSRENLQKHMADIGRLNTQIFDQAMRMLTPEQFEAFKASIQATTDMQMAQLEMAGQLLRGGE